MHSLYCWPGALALDLPSLDPLSLVAASYCQLLIPDEWQLVESIDPAASPSGQLPYLVHDEHVYAGAAILQHLVSLQPSTTSTPEAAAFRALLDQDILPLVLHSLFSLPKNYTFIRTLLCASLPFPTNLYRPETLRASAKSIVEASHEEWWNLGGEAEKDEEDERRRKRVLLESGPDGMKRKAEEKKEGKEKMKRAFGEGRIAAAALECFAALEATLSKSTTPFFFSSPVPMPLDAQLSSLLSLVLYIPLPQPLLRDQINSTCPRLFSHTALLRRTLWTTSPERMRQPFGLVATLSAIVPLIPRLDLSLFSSGVKSKPKATRKETNAEKDFRQKRNLFLGVVGVSVVGWALGTGAISLFKLGAEEEGDWEDVE